MPANFPEFCPGLPGMPFSHLMKFVVVVELIFEVSFGEVFSDESSCLALPAKTFALDWMNWIAKISVKSIFLALRPAAVAPRVLHVCHCE